METPAEHIVARRHSRSTVSIGKLLGIGEGGVPRTLLNQAPARVMIMALIGATVYTVHIGMSVFLHPAYMPMPEDRTLPIAAWLAFVSASGLISLVAWRRWVRPELLLDLALCYEVIGAFFVAFAEQLLPWPEPYSVRGISWICAWIIAYQLMVPATPLKVFLAALLAAAMGPLVLLISVAGGNPLPSTEVMLALFVPTFLCAFAAIALSTHLYELFRDFERAKRLGSYKLVERLGEGGMGEVWRAEHKMLARPAAIKLIKSERLGAGVGSAGRVLSKRFEREAQATAMLTSPHTIDIYDFGVTRDGRFYYVMEYLDGLDLETAVKRFGPVPAERAIHLLGQVCHSLAEAHSTGLIHRDIKPSNIFVCRRGLEYDFAKELDFGLVKIDTGPAGELSQLTEAGSVTGTPSYMAPEMATTPDRVDYRTDLYALGCVGYWLLAGRPVFEGQSQMNVIMQHIQNTPPRLSQMTELEVPSALEELLLRCLAKAPDDRPQTASALCNALVGIQTTRAWTHERAEAWWQQHVPEAIGTKPSQEPISPVFLVAKEHESDQQR